MSFNLKYQHLRASANPWAHLFNLNSFFALTSLGGLITAFLVIFFPCKKAVLMSIKLISQLNDAIRLVAVCTLSLECVNQWVFWFFFFSFQILNPLACNLAWVAILPSMIIGFRNPANWCCGVTIVVYFFLNILWFPASWYSLFGLKIFTFYFCLVNSISSGMSDWFSGLPLILRSLIGIDSLSIKGLWVDCCSKLSSSHLSMSRIGVNEWMNEWMNEWVNESIFHNSKLQKQLLKVSVKF